MLVVNKSNRTIEGRAIPYSVPGLNNGWRVQYAPGALRWQLDTVKLLIRHNHALIVGKALSLENTDSGLRALFLVSRGPKGDRALEMAATTHGGLSVGVVDMTTVVRGNVWLCEDAELVEVSLTPNPVFK